MTSYEKFEASSPENRRLLRRSELLLDVQCALCEAMDDSGVTRAELARRLDKTPGFITQILSSGRNLTLKTIADVADAIGCSVKVTMKAPDEAQERRTRC